ncbi:MAG TPA: hypothetical protein VFS29_00815 [Motilibacteraceae bacterium]|nr:hypothetical protein [Motilibacteraceae bacterium]
MGEVRVASEAEQTRDRGDGAPQLVGRVVLLALGAVLLALAAYAVGARGSGTRVLQGPAVVGGADVATFTVRGTYYGVRDSVPWVDAGGAHHDAGWPACLEHLRTVASVRFAVAAVDEPDGARGDRVVWVDCRG